MIGVGGNVGASPPAEEVDAPATCIADHCGAVERVRLVRALLRRLDFWVDRIAGGDLEALHEAWLGRCRMINERITVLSAGVRHTGRVLDVSPLEGLVLSCDDGRHVHLPAVGASVVRGQQ